VIRATPTILEHTYELLRLTQPFKRWKLPPADDVEFHVINNRDRAADHCLVRTTHKIRISAKLHSSLRTITETMAHEMVHVRERMLGLRADVEHGEAFHKLADEVCRHHGFDRGQF
jgi:hypothetical protein